MNYLNEMYSATQKESSLSHEKEASEEQQPEKEKNNGENLHVSSKNEVGNDIPGSFRLSPFVCFILNKF